jgi:hypothetical protein
MTNSDELERQKFEEWMAKDNLKYDLAKIQGNRISANDYCDEALSICWQICSAAWNTRAEMEKSDE